MFITACSFSVVLFITIKPVIYIGMVVMTTSSYDQLCLMLYMYIRGHILGMGPHIGLDKIKLLSVKLSIFSNPSV